MKKFFALMLFGLVSLSTVCAFAEQTNSERSVTGFFRRVFNYPVKAAQETGEMTSNTLNNTGEKVVAPLVSDPGASIPGTAETVGQAVAETVQVPVKAAEETPAS